MRIEPSGRNEDRVLDRARVPDVAEPQNAGIDRHEVDTNALNDPATDRGALIRAFGEPMRAQPSGELHVVHPGHHVDDAIDVLGWSRSTGGRVRDEQLADHPSDEDDLSEDVAETAGDGPELSGRLHPLSLRSISWAASFRSRARPARTASTRASHS